MISESRAPQCWPLAGGEDIACCWTGTDTAPLPTRGGPGGDWPSALAVAIPVAVLGVPAASYVTRARPPRDPPTGRRPRRVGARPRRRPARRHRGELVVRPQPADGRCSRGGDAAAPDGGAGRRPRGSPTSAARPATARPATAQPPALPLLAGQPALAHEADVGAEPGRRRHSGALQRLLPAERRLSRARSSASPG